jgi:VanZ family protein
MSDQSGQLRFRYRTLWLVMGWALVLAIVYLSLTPHPIEIQVEEGDKMGHLLAYGTLMLWFAQLYDTTKARCLLAVGCVALGVGLEFAQIFTDARSFELADMAADAAGAGIGWVLAPPRLFNFLFHIEAVLP